MIDGRVRRYGMDAGERGKMEQTGDTANRLRRLALHEQAAQCLLLDLGRCGRMVQHTAKDGEENAIPRRATRLVQNAIDHPDRQRSGTALERFDEERLISGKALESAHERT